MSETPQAPLSIDEEQQQFYAALGAAITQWQYVELGLGRVFCALMGTDRVVSANMAFNTILSFDAKLGMTHSAAISVLGRTPLWSRWSPLHNRASRRNDRRNQLAHFQLVGDFGKKPGYRFHLQPNIFDFRAIHRWGAKPPTLNVHQIVASARAFDKLGAELNHFANTVFQLRSAPHEASDTPSTHQPQEPHT